MLRQFSYNLQETLKQFSNWSNISVMLKKKYKNGLPG